MSHQAVGLETAAANRSVNRRLRLLVSLHLLLATAPLAIAAVPTELRFLPLMWALSSVRAGQLMLLSFWAGMGLSPARWRSSSALLGCVYLAIWPSLGFMFAPGVRDKQWWTDRAVLFAAAVRMNLVIFLVLTGVLLFIRRKFSELRFVAEAERTAPARVQYSILTVLLITAVIALLLALMRGAQPGSAGDWQKVAATALGGAAFLIDALCAVWAALGVGRIGWRVSLVLLVASVLGFAQAFAGRIDRLGWWLAPGMAAALLITSGIVIVSLLVVRSCGYRLRQIR